jgi:hypothetical protein
MNETIKRKRLINHMIFGGAVLVSGGLLWVTAKVCKGSWVPEYTEVAIRAAYSLMLAAGFWLVTAFFASLRDVGR